MSDSERIVSYETFAGDRIRVRAKPGTPPADMIQWAARLGAQANALDSPPLTYEIVWPEVGIQTLQEGWQAALNDQEPVSEHPRPICKTKIPHPPISVHPRPSVVKTNTAAIHPSPQISPPDLSSTSLHTKPKPHSMLVIKPAESFHPRHRSFGIADGQWRQRLLKSEKSG